MSKDAWAELKGNYPVSKTPESLKSAIISHPAKGRWRKHGFIIDYTAEKQFNVICVSTEDVARNGGCCGATCYINADNPNQCVWDV